jgi:molecular chaperone DnaK (HSP70)
VDLRDRHPGAYARLWWAAEAAKRQLSTEPYARVREESLVVVDGRPLHLDVEITREQYETLIRPLVEQTMESASKALSDAGLLPAALDAILLVGGSTRTPLVVQMLEKLCGKAPRQDLHPDLCVALGAGVLASRLGGHSVQRVLVDVSPFSFGIAYLGFRDGREYPYCYRPVIKRNTPLPVTRTEEYFTAADFQTAVEMQVYQGDDPDALRNVHVGQFRIEGMKPVAGPNPVLCRMRLDVDGILHVTAIEKETGLSKHVSISGATRRRDAAEVAKGREELARLFGRRVREGAEGIVEPVPPAEQVVGDGLNPVAENAGPAPTESLGAGAPAAAPDADVAPEGTSAAPSAGVASASEARAIVARARARIPSMHPDDQEEAVGLIEDVESALNSGDTDALASATKAMNEFLFFVEGR